MSIFQPNPHDVGDVTAQDIRPIGSRLSNYNAMTHGTRRSNDRILSHTGFSKQLNPERTVTNAFLSHGTDWALFNYNPYGKSNDVHGFTNPNRRRLTDDWALIIGVGDVDLDVVGAGEGTGITVKYMNYPDEGWSSFGKKYDKRWKWFGNSWIPAV